MKRTGHALHSAYSGVISDKLATLACTSWRRAPTPRRSKPRRRPHKARPTSAAGAQRSLKDSPCCAAGVVVVSLARDKLNAREKRGGLAFEWDNLSEAATNRRPKESVIFLGRQPDCCAMMRLHCTLNPCSFGCRGKELKPMVKQFMTCVDGSKETNENNGTEASSTGEPKAA